MQPDDPRALLYAMEHTHLLVPPRQTLFTFAPTNVRYSMLTPQLKDAGVELRQGRLTVGRPAVITPVMLFEQLFEGFDQEQRSALERLLRSGVLRGLEYKFSNQVEHVETRHEALDDLVERLKRESEARPLSRSAVIQGVPQLWSLSLMKCALDLMALSLPSNLRDLEEHGSFGPG